MGLFALEISDDDYVRWVFNRERYISWNLSYVAVRDYVTDKSREDLPEFFPHASPLFYMKESDLTGLGPPQPLFIYYDDGKNVLKLEVSNLRFMKGCFETFKQGLEITLEEFDQVSDNPYNRFDNSSQTVRYHWFCNSDERREAKKYLSGNQRIHSQNRLLDNEPGDGGNYVKLSVNRKFNTYCDKTLIITKADSGSLSKTTIRQVHDEYFKKSFTSKKKEIFFHNVITRDALKAWFNFRRSTTQKRVMNNNSAVTTAMGLGLPFGLQYEWLHLIAHSMGPSRYEEDPQNTENLVLGTAAANTQMLAHECLIKQEVLRGRQLKIFVKKTLREFDDRKYATWLASNIEYTYTIYDDKRTLFSETIHFNPFQDIRPSFGEAMLIKKFCGCPV